jgi:hypothetical protein
MEDWEVDARGNFIRVIESLEVDHGPNPDSTWTCLECGTEAIVTRDGDDDEATP